MNYSDFPFTLNVFNHVKHRELPCVWSRLALPKGQSEKHRKIYSGKWSQCIFLHMQMYEKHYSDVGANSIYWRKKKEYVCSSMKKDKMTHSALTCFARLYVCQFSALYARSCSVHVSKLRLHYCSLSLHGPWLMDHFHDQLRALDTEAHWVFRHMLDYNPDPEWTCRIGCIHSHK